MAGASWKDRLAGQMVPEWADEIDLFEGQIELRKQGKLEEKVFAETRLRRGVYGQRYDNGQRADGIAVRTLPYDDRSPPRDPRRCGTRRAWCGSRFPFGGVSPEQLEVLADLSEEYSDSILHVTTRQDIQLHYVHIEDTPDLMRRLAAVGDHHARGLRELGAQRDGVPPLRCVCDRGVRRLALRQAPSCSSCSVTPTCRTSGASSSPPSRAASTRPAAWCRCTTPASWPARRTASAASRSWSAAASVRCRTRPRCCRSSRPRRSCCPQMQAVARVYARLGEKKNRGRSRIKFLVAKLGIEEFRQAGARRSARSLPHDDRWTAFLKDMPHTQRRARARARGPPGANGTDARRKASTPGTRPTSWRQRQEGYCTSSP